MSYFYNFRVVKTFLMNLEVENKKLWKNIVLAVSVMLAAGFTAFIVLDEPVNNVDQVNNSTAEPNTSTEKYLDSMNYSQGINYSELTSQCNSLNGSLINQSRNGSNVTDVYCKLG